MRPPTGADGPHDRASSCIPGVSPARSGAEDTFAVPTSPIRRTDPTAPVDAWVVGTSSELNRLDPAWRRIGRSAAAVGRAGRIGVAVIFVSSAGAAEHPASWNAAHSASAIMTTRCGAEICNDGDDTGRLTSYVHRLYVGTSPAPATLVTRRAPLRTRRPDSRLHGARVAGFPRPSASFSRPRPVCRDVPTDRAATGDRASRNAAAACTSPRCTIPTATSSPHPAVA